jgi:hypothetical protein
MIVTKGGKKQKNKTTMIVVNGGEKLKIKYTVYIFMMSLMSAVNQTTNLEAVKANVIELC